MPCPVMSHAVAHSIMSCHIVPCRMMSCPFISVQTIYAIPYHARSAHIGYDVSSHIPKSSSKPRLIPCHTIHRDSVKIEFMTLSSLAHCFHSGGLMRACSTRKRTASDAELVSITSMPSTACFAAASALHARSRSLHHGRHQ